MQPTQTHTLTPCSDLGTGSPGIRVGGDYDPLNKLAGAAKPCCVGAVMGAKQGWWEEWLGEVRAHRGGRTAFLRRGCRRGDSAGTCESQEIATCGEGHSWALGGHTGHSRCSHRGAQAPTEQ